MERGREPMSLRMRLEEARPILGMVIQYPGEAAEMVRVASDTGHDFAFLDRQHAAFGPGEIAAATLAARRAGIAVLLRLRDPRDEPATGPAILGLDGVIVPELESADEAVRLSSALSRMRADDPAFLLVGMIESRRGLAEASTIAGVEGIDVLHVGCVDLGAALGTPGDFGSSQVMAAVEQIGCSALAAGKTFGVGGDRDPARLARYASRGARFFTTGVDRLLLRNAARDAATRIRDAISKSGQGGVP